MGTSVPASTYNIKPALSSACLLSPSSPSICYSSHPLSPGVIYLTCTILSLNLFACSFDATTLLSLLLSPSPLRHITGKKPFFSPPPPHSFLPPCFAFPLLLLCLCSTHLALLSPLLISHTPSCSSSGMHYN